MNRLQRMNKRILVLGGDGIGPEVTAQAVLVLQAVAKKFNHSFSFENGLIGAAAIAATGEPLPEATLTAAHTADAILLGAVGLPEYDKNPGAKVRPEQGLLRLRQALDLFANVRPVSLFSELTAASSIKPEVLQNVDILFFRELVGGIYFGEPRGCTPDRTEAFDTMRYTKPMIQRVVRLAFQAAQTRKQKLCSVDKANVLETSRLWREVVQAEASHFPDVAVTHLYVDNAAMQLIRQPSQFDVIVTENMFGDILTDEAAELAGSLGLLASASIGPNISLFEPIHGSAPDIMGQNKANPIAAILSAELMCRHAFHLTAEADAIRLAIQAVIRQGLRTPDIFTGGIVPGTASPEQCVTTTAFGQAVLKHI